MKLILSSVLVALMSATMTGCYEATPAFAVHRGLELCKPNGGVKQFLSSQPLIKVDCVNGARFVIDLKRTNFQ